MKKIAAGLLSAGLIIGFSWGAGDVAEAKTKVKTYKNCKALKIKNGNWDSPLEDMLCIHPKELAYEINAVLKKTCEHQYVDETGA
ncbi:hypothetical protein DT075_02810 [Bacillus licheniformis]|nr:hypothetical protein DT075_02810 [Bacillus licheniformis]